MKNIKLMSLIIVILALILHDAAWARGGHGGSAGHRHGGGGHGHAGGGHGHVGGGHGHFGGGHRHHGHNRFNLGINAGFYNPGFYGGGFYNPGFYGGGFYGYRDPFFYRRYYSYPRTVVVPMAPPVYIQQQQAKPVQPQTNYWYYCRNPEGYYPYVKQCPEGWLQVAPQPPTQ